MTAPLSPELVQVLTATGPSDHVVCTGPMRTDIELDDGTLVDCRPYAVVVHSEAHRDELLHKIGLFYEKHGHPHLDTGVKFRYDRPKRAE